MENIFKEFRDKKIKFHSIIETEMFNESLIAYQNELFLSSSSTIFSLYEKLFTTRLIRESSYPEGFIADNSNIKEQLEYLMEREEKIINEDKLSFSKIIKELKKLNIFSEEEFNDFIEFYKQYRNPTLHGLTCRLYQTIFSKKPNNMLELDLNYKKIYKKLAEIGIKKVYELSKNNKLLKK